MTAAITAAKEMSTSTDNKNKKIVLVEASPTYGGRVQSDVTDDGFILDRGFAVFIEQYPLSRQLLDYEALELGQFLPGAMVKLDDSSFAKVVDPLRQPRQLFTALLSPIGSFVDKLKVLPLLKHVFTKSIAELFDEPETTTLYALEERYGFSSSMIDVFYKPFLEGIYLSPLQEQSSRMLHFVFKMFSEGAATLPKGGMGAVTLQLVQQAQAAGVELKNNHPVSALKENGGGGGFIVESSSANGRIIIEADQVIVATEGPVAESLLSQIVMNPSIKEATIEPQPQRSVGCLYYSFNGDAPISEPILGTLWNEREAWHQGLSNQQPLLSFCRVSILCATRQVTLLRDCVEHESV